MKKQTAEIGVQVNLNSPPRKSSPPQQQVVELVDLESVGNKRVPRLSIEKSTNRLVDHFSLDPSWNSHAQSQGRGAIGVWSGGMGI